MPMLPHGVKLQPLARGVVNEKRAQVPAPPAQ
jgi:hypothetical protein